MGPIPSRTSLAVLIACLVLPLTFDTSPGQSCEEYDQYLRWKSSTFNPGGIAAMTFHDGLLYYGNGSALHVSIPGGAQGPETIATAYDSLSTLSALAGTGESVLVGNASGRIVSFDVSNPASPVLQDFLEPNPPDSEVMDIEVADGVAYASQYARGVRILDISDPSSLSVLGTLYPNHTAYAMHVQGQKLYTTTNDGLEILDITDPAAPTFLGVAPLDYLRQAIEVVGTTAYVADGPAGLQVVDVSDATSPVVVGTITDVRHARDAVADGNRLFVSDFDGSADRYVWILDISNPGSPVIVGTVRSGGQAETVLVHDGELYVEAGDLVVYQDIHLPLPAPVAQMDGWQSSMDVEIFGAVAYLPDYHEGLRTIDVSDPTHPIELGLAPTAGNPLHVSLHGDYAYVAAREGGLSVVDVSDPASPVEVGTFDTAGRAMEVDVQNGYAYVADDGDGLVILDVSDPELPVLVSVSPSYADARAIMVDGPTAYVGSAYSGLHIVDVSVPATPATLASEDFLGRPVDFAKVGDLLYSLSSLGDLRIWDVAKADQPTLLSTSAVEASFGICVDDEFAYLGDRIHGVMVADVRDPAAPRLVGNANVPGRLNGIALSGGHVFTASPPVTMAVVEIQCPRATGIVGSPDRPMVRFTSLRPNPFNPRVLIEFELQRPGNVALDIYDVAGRHVRSLASEVIDRGLHTRVWDGTDSNRRPVGSGVYHARIRAGAVTETSKVTLLR